MEVLRTPEARFAGLPEFGYEPHYVDVSRGIDGAPWVDVADGLRMAYIEAGQGDPILCVHGEPSWSFLYRKMIPLLAEVGRVVVPDLLGFGRSDKPVARDDYTYQLHYDALFTFVRTLGLERITLVCQDWGGLLGLPLAADLQERFARLVIMNTGLPVSGKPLSPAFMAWRAYATRSDDLDVAKVLQGATVTELSPEVLAGYEAPYPDKTYKSGAIQFPLLVPISEDNPALANMRRAAEVLRTWQKPALVMFSDQDPVTAGGDKYFRALLPTAAAEPEITIAGGGHFLQEDQGPEIARHIVEFIRRRPSM